MTDLEDMLDTLAEAERHPDPLPELEQKRLHQMTIEKIAKEGSEQTASDKTSFLTFRLSKAVAAILILALIGVAGTRAAAHFGLDQSIRSFFHIGTEDTKRAEKLVSQPVAECTSQGITISVSQVIGDKSRFYTVFDAENIPETTKKLAFEDTSLTMGTPEAYDYTCDGPSMESAGKHSANFSILVSGINKNGEEVDIDRKTVTLTLHNLGYYDSHDKFISIADGQWTLTWTFTTQASTRTIAVNRNIMLMDSSCKWTDIVISPLSLTVHNQVIRQGKQHFSEEEWKKYEKSDRILVTLTDGTTINSHTADDVSESWGDEDTPGYQTLGFDRLIDPDEVASVTYGNKTIFIQPMSEH